MGRAPCCDKANVKRGPWSPEEDAKLKSYIEENGTGGNWIALPHKIGLKRCGKSCRLRWLNYLRPNIKHGSFSEEEDHIICTLYLSIGSRWSIIAAQLPGRTDNDIKNYWNTRLKKKLMGNKQRKDQQSPPKRGAGQMKQEETMKREVVLEDLIKEPSLCMMSMNFYHQSAAANYCSSWPPTQFPLILTNPNHHQQELDDDHIENHQDHPAVFDDQYHFENQPQLFDPNVDCDEDKPMSSTTTAAYHPQLPNNNTTPYYGNGEGIINTQFHQDFNNNYSFGINEFVYNTIQLEHFDDGLSAGLDNLVNRSNCISSSAESSTISWGDHPTLACPPPHPPTMAAYEDCRRGLLQNCPSSRTA